MTKFARRMLRDNDDFKSYMLKMNFCAIADPGPVAPGRR